MNIRQVVAVLLIIFLLTSCAHSTKNENQLCNAIETFANASNDESEHSIELATDWEGMPSGQNKHCSDFGYSPGTMLCSYLINHSSAEFATNNFRQVMVCLGFHSDTIPADFSIERLDAKYWSYGAKNIRSDVQLGVELSMGGDKVGTSLKILARKRTDPK